MRRFIRFALLFTGVQVLAVVVAVSIGQRQPVSERLSLLHLTDCAPPCWIGIIPGVTTMDQAKIRVQMTYHKAASFMFDIDGVTAILKSESDPYHPVMVVISAADYSNTAPVRSITFHFDNAETGDFTLPELFSLIDEPSRIIYATVATRYSLYLSMDYKPRKPLGLEVMIDSTSRRLEWSQHPRWLRFSGALDLGELERWRGFAAFATDRYGRLR